MPTMSSQPFNVPGVPDDLRQEETVHQLVDSLEYLDKVANEIFTRIHNKVSTNGDQLRKLNDRISLAQAKIDKIKGSNKATKVFASAKYPSQDAAEFYMSVFEKEEGLREPKRPNYHTQAKHRLMDDAVLKGKLQYYHVKGGQRKSNDANKGEGLGGLPKKIPSVSSLLLFNTSENPYKKYVMLDPLGVITKTRTALEEESLMADAPNTIKTNEELQRQQAESYLYVPGIGQVPELDVPIALPNLLGVADDVMYSAELGNSIAPSVMGSNMPELPSVVPESETVPVGPTAGGGAPPPPPAGPPPAEPPPPPPPPPGPPPPPPPGGAPPPPPPPAAGPPPPPPAEVPAEVSSGDGGRASLMDAIRKAGGAGKASLKSAKEKKDDAKKKRKEEKSAGSTAAVSSGGGDLMSDLFSKLTMRRRGISGDKKGGDAGGGGGAEKSESSSGGGGAASAMDKISSMIPSPPKMEPVAEKTGGEDDEDWE